MGTLLALLLLVLVQASGCELGVFRLKLRSMGVIAAVVMSSRRYHRPWPLQTLQDVSATPRAQTGTFGATPRCTHNCRSVLISLM